MTATDMPMTIVRAAIRCEAHGFHSLPAPARHHDVIHAMHANGCKKTTIRDQGFETSNGEFVDRKEAARIAMAAGQVPQADYQLIFSEDLW